MQNFLKGFSGDALGVSRAAAAYHESVRTDSFRCVLAVAL